jgi:hypothetical protein
VLVVPVKAEVLRRSVVVGGYEVDAGATAAKMVIGRRKPRPEIGRIESRRHRGDYPKPFCHLSHQRHKRHRVGLGGAHGVAKVCIHRAAIGVRNQRAVLDHHIVEAGAVQSPSEVEINGRAGPVPEVVTPPTLLPAVNREAAAHKPTEMHHRARIPANQQQRTSKSLGNVTAKQTTDRKHWISASI